MQENNYEMMTVKSFRWCKPVKSPEAVSSAEIFIVVIWIASGYRSPIGFFPALGSQMTFCSETGYAG
jgi:hypothetical protein